MKFGVLGAALFLVAVLVPACSLDAARERLGEEPMLGAPPDALELLRTEIAGTSLGFGTPARIEIVWGVDDTDAAADWYLREHADRYDLDRQVDRAHWLGQRAAGDMTVTTALRVSSSIADLPWETMLGAEGDAGAWDGPVVMVRVSSTGP